MSVMAAVSGLVLVAAACGGPAAAPAATTAPAAPAATKAAAPAAGATTAPAAPAATKPAAAAPAAGATAAPVVAGEPTASVPPAANAKHIKLNDQVADDHPQQKAFRAFSRRVQELTKGQLVIDVFPNSTLGTPRETIEQLQIGQLEMAKVSTAALSGFVPQFQVFDLPYVFKSREHLFKHVDGEVGSTLNKMLADKLGIKSLGYFDAGARSIFTTKKQVKTLADLKGQKIRVMESPLMISTFNLMGAAATPMAYGELYSALQQGVVDAAENSTVAYKAMKHYEPAKLFSFTEHFMTPDMPMVSLKWYSAQPKEIQDAVDQAAKELITSERKFWLEYEGVVVEDLKKLGVQFTDVDKAPFAKAVEPVLKEFEPKIGKDLMDKALVQ